MTSIDDFHERARDHRKRQEENRRRYMIHRFHEGHMKTSLCLADSKVTKQIILDALSDGKISLVRYIEEIKSVITEDDVRLVPEAHLNSFFHQDDLYISKEGLRYLGNDYDLYDSSPSGIPASPGPDNAEIAKLKRENGLLKAKFDSWALSIEAAYRVSEWVNALKTKIRRDNLYEYLSRKGYDIPNDLVNMIWKSIPGDKKAGPGRPKKTP